jgi:hypothetical protein
MNVAVCRRRSTLSAQWLSGAVEVNTNTVAISRNTNP